VSRSTVRHMTADYLTAGAPAGVGKVFASPPKTTVAADRFANAPAGTPSGSVIYVEITRSQEVRVGLGGPVAGKKTVTHDVMLHLAFTSMQARAEDAMDDHDGQVEAILDLIRADRTLGTTVSSPSPIFVAGEETAGITVSVGLPRTAGGGVVEIWSIVELQVVEIINA